MHQYRDRFLICLPVSPIYQYARIKVRIQVRITACPHDELKGIAIVAFVLVYCVALSVYSALTTYASAGSDAWDDAVGSANFSSTDDGTRSGTGERIKTLTSSRSAVADPGTISATFETYASATIGS